MAHLFCGWLSIVLVGCAIHERSLIAAENDGGGATGSVAQGTGSGGAGGAAGATSGGSAGNVSGTAGSGASDGGDTSAVGRIGDRCANTGAKGCEGHASKQLVVCNFDRWGGNGMCTGQQVCDSEPGPGVGLCRDVVPECAGAQPGTFVCLQNRRVQCGPDLVTTVPAPCAEPKPSCQNGACIAAVCATGEASCDGGTLSKCTTDRLGFTSTRCASERLCNADAGVCVPSLACFSPNSPHIAPPGDGSCASPWVIDLRSLPRGTVVSRYGIGLRSDQDFTSTRGPSCATAPREDVYLVLLPPGRGMEVSGVVENFAGGRSKVSVFRGDSCANASNPYCIDDGTGSCKAIADDVAMAAIVVVGMNDINPVPLSFRAPP